MCTPAGPGVVYSVLLIRPPLNPRRSCRQSLTQPALIANMRRCDKVYLLQDKGIRMHSMRRSEPRDVRWEMFMSMRKLLQRMRCTW